MTAYVASHYFGSTQTLTTSIGLLANTYPIRIAKIELGTANGGSQPLNMFRYSGAGLSGGTTLTTAPLRQGAPSSTVTAKVNATASGTSLQLTSQLVAANTASYPYQFTFDVLVQPGSAFYVSSTIVPIPGSGITYLNTPFMIVYYEEIRLAYSL